MSNALGPIMRDNQMKVGDKEFFDRLMKMKIDRYIPDSTRMKKEYCSSSIAYARK